MPVFKPGMRGAIQFEGKTSPLLEEGKHDDDNMSTSSKGTGVIPSFNSKPWFLLLHLHVDWLSDLQLVHGLMFERKWARTMCWKRTRGRCFDCVQDDVHRIEFVAIHMGYERWKWGLRWSRKIYIRWPIEMETTRSFPVQNGFASVSARRRNVAGASPMLTARALSPPRCQNDENSPACCTYLRSCWQCQVFLSNNQHGEYYRLVPLVTQKNALNFLMRATANTCIHPCMPVLVHSQVHTIRLPEFSSARRLRVWQGCEIVSMGMRSCWPTCETIVFLPPLLGFFRAHICGNPNAHHPLTHSHAQPSPYPWGGKAPWSKGRSYVCYLFSLNVRCEHGCIHDWNQTKMPTHAPTPRNSLCCTVTVTSTPTLQQTFNGLKTAVNGFQVSH